MFRSIPFSSAVGVIALLATDVTFAQSEYHLFNPKPADELRPLAADRPDATESPITVDPGHVQIELSFVDYSTDNDLGEDVTTWNFADTNIKLGLTENVDLQFMFAAYTEQRSNPSGAPSRTINGFGDVTLRMKVNLWGNDGGETAFGIMPFIKIPVETELSNGKVEGGFIAMMSWDVGETWGLGFQGEIDTVYDDADSEYDVEFLHTVVLGVDLVGPLGGYVEYVGILSTDADVRYQALASFGLTYEVNANLVFDIGTQVGLNEDANDLNIFTGMTIRF